MIVEYILGKMEHSMNLIRTHPCTIHILFGIKHIFKYQYHMKHNYQYSNKFGLQLIIQLLYPTQQHNYERQLNIN